MGPCHQVAGTVTVHLLSHRVGGQIAYFAVGVSGNSTELGFAVVLMAFVGVQVYLKPFASSHCNQAEFILLSALPIVVMSRMAAVRQYMFADLVVTVLVLLPIPLMALFVSRVVRKEWKQWVADHRDLDSDLPDLDMDNLPERDRVHTLSKQDSDTHIATGTMTHIAMTNIPPLNVIPETTTEEGGADIPTAATTADDGATECE